MSNLYEHLKEETMILANFNYDSYESFEKDGLIYKVFLNMPLNNKMLLIIAEDKKNGNWFFREIPNISEDADGLGVQTEKYSKIINKTINLSFKVNPKELESIILTKIPK